MKRSNTWLYVVAVGVFSFVAATPVYAGQGFFGRFFRNGDQQEVSVASTSPRPGRIIHEDVRENMATHPGGLRGFLQTRGIIQGNITAINGTTLTVSTKDGKSYTVQTDDKTQFRRRFWGKGSLAEMSVGDFVNVIGKWTDDSHTTIQAILVRDLSIQKFMGVFFGTIQSLTNSGWVMTTIGRGNQTVTISSSTKLTNRKGQTISQSDIAVGHKVRVHGMWDRTANTITEATAVKDFSLPLAPSGTVAPTPTPTAAPTP